MSTSTVYVTQIRRQGSTAIAYGFDLDGQPVIFSGEWRPMATIEEQLAGSPMRAIPCQVEPWQILASMPAKENA